MDPVNISTLQCCAISEISVFHWTCCLNAQDSCQLWQGIGLVFVFVQHSLSKPAKYESASAVTV